MQIYRIGKIEMDIGIDHHRVKSWPVTNGLRFSPQHVLISASTYGNKFFCREKFKNVYQPGGLGQLVLVFAVKLWLVGNVLTCGRQHFFCNTSNIGDHR